MLHRVLQRANLLQYYDAFISQGGDDVNQLCEAGEDEFLEIMALVGMASKPLHVRRLQKALLEWILHPNMFVKPLPDRRVVPSVLPSRGSIYAALQQESAAAVTASHGSNPRSVNGNGVEPLATDGLGGRNFQSVRRDVAVAQHNPATPNSDEFSDPDASFDSSMKGQSASPSSFSSTASQLTDEQIAAIAMAASDMAKTLPQYAPKPLNMKKPIDKEIQEAMVLLEDNPNRLDLLRKYSAIYARFDSKRKLDKHMNFHEICINEAAAQLCRYRPSLLTRREDLFNLARQVVKDSCFQYPKAVFSGLPQGQGQGLEPPTKLPRTKSPIPSSTATRPKVPPTSSLVLTVDDDQEAASGIMPPSAFAHPTESKDTSLVDEGIRIARVYGLGPEFEEELQELKKEVTQGSGSNVGAEDDSVSEEQAEWQREVENDSINMSSST
jgi:hypothetical protein